MAPRESYGDKPMTSAERVRRARWVNRFEETAFKLLDLLNEVPDPLPRKPAIPNDLIEKLRPFISTSKQPPMRKSEMGQTAVRVLKPGNGNQVRNKKLAMQFIAKHLNAETIDPKETVRTANWGLCHVSAYTDPKSAMISTPKKDDQIYGGADWHKNDHKILFRDVGDGRCIIYICKIERLFDSPEKKRNGVTWENIEKLSSHTEVLKSEEVLKELDV